MPPDFPGLLRLVESPLPLPGSLRISLPNPMCDWPGRRRAWFPFDSFAIEVRNRVVADRGLVAGAARRDWHRARSTETWRSPRRRAHGAAHSADGATAQIAAGIVRPGLQPLRQNLGHFAGRLVAGFRLLGHHPQANIDQRRRRIFSFFVNARGHLVLMLPNALRQTTIRKWRMTGEQEIQRAAQTIDVGPFIDRVAVASLLRRQIVGRAKHIFFVGDGQRCLFAIIFTRADPRSSNLTVPR